MNKDNNGLVRLQQSSYLHRVKRAHKSLLLNIRQPLLLIKALMANQVNNAVPTLHSKELGVLVRAEPGFYAWGGVGSVRGEGVGERKGDVTARE